MSSTRAIATRSRAIFDAEGGREHITRFDNRVHSASRIEPTQAYPTSYEVGRLLSTIVVDN